MHRINDSIEKSKQDFKILGDKARGCRNAGLRRKRENVETSRGVMKDVSWGGRVGVDSVRLKNERRGGIMKGYVSGQGEYANPRGIYHQHPQATQSSQNTRGKGKPSG